MAYVGQGIKGGTFSVLDTSGNTYNGSNVTFDLGTQVGSPAQLLVSHDGVIQKPVTDYTIATGGTQITFTTAPASGASIFITEISGAVGAPMNRDINGDELILDADADTSITADTDDQVDIKVGGSDIATLTSSALTLKNSATADNSTFTVNLQTAEADIAADDVLAKINFQAPNEGTGTDANLIAASIQATSEGDFSSSSNATKLEFMTGASEAATTKMSISSGGIVGMGATLPGDLGVGLHIKTSDSGASVNNDGDELVIENGGSGLMTGMTFLSATNGYGGICFGDSGDDNIGIIRYDHNDNCLDFFANASERMTITSDGDIGVGTQDPGTARFNVQKDSHQLYYGKNDTSGQFQVTYQGVISATNTTVQSISDERLKKDIADFSGGLNIVKAMKPRTYKWKNPQYHNDKDDTQYGFVAQELLTISDAEKLNLVVVDNANTMMYENEKDLLPDGKANISGYQEKDAIYVSAIKELLTKIETLETKVKALEDA